MHGRRVSSATVATASNPMLIPGLRTLAVIGLLAVSISANAQWSTISEVDADTGDSVLHTKTLVKSTQGASLKIFLSADQQLIAEFWLGNGLLSLDSISCPTLQIDKTPPENFNLPQHQCEVYGAQARFILSRNIQDQLVSQTFLELMNGSRLRISYRLQGVGYSQQEFSLKGSKQALQAIIGNGIEIVGDSGS